MAALNLASPDKLNRVALVAVELFDPVSLSLVWQGASVTAKGLAGRPIIGLSGRFAWLAERPGRPEDDRWPSAFVFDPGHLPYESEIRPAPARPADLRNPGPGESRIVRITLRPTAAYPFTDGVTVVRGCLRETDDRTSAVIAGAEVWLRWSSEPAGVPKDAAVKAKTNAAGDFAAFLRLPTDARPKKDKDKLEVRVMVSRGGQNREKAYSLPEGRLYDLPEALAWSALTTV